MARGNRPRFWGTAAAIVISASIAGGGVAAIAAMLLAVDPSNPSGYALVAAVAAVWLILWVNVTVWAYVSSKGP